MNGVAMTEQTKRRRLLVRLGLCVVYAVAIGLVFVYGKGHTVILDNKDTEDGSVKALETVSISLDGQEPTDLQAGDRDMAKVRGQKHLVEITINGQKYQTRVTLPLGEDTLLLSVPRLVAGKPAIETFVPKDAPPAADDNAGNSNAFTSPTDPAAVPGAPGAPSARRTCSRTSSKTPSPARFSRTSTARSRTAPWPRTSPCAAASCRCPGAASPWTWTCPCAHQILLLHSPLLLLHLHSGPGRT